MRKLKYLMLVSLVSAMLTSVTVVAAPIGSRPSPPPTSETPSTPSDGGGDSGGGDSGGGGGGSSEPEPVVPELPKEMTFSPVVTTLHSVNAALSEAGQAVYFLPLLSEFPTDLKDTCADITTADGNRHQFSVVYDGYFDSEVLYQSASKDAGDGVDTSRLQTSKKVYSTSDNSRALNLLGYDLLLSREDCNLYTEGETVLADYMPTFVGQNALSAKTVIMDLYKAVGTYEWDIKVIFGDAPYLYVSTSPLMQNLVVAINDDASEKGIVTDEGECWVFASRTNPDLYWERCKRDAIFDGGAHLYTRANYVGNDVSATFSKVETDSVSMGEFCVLARAIMELYGEPVLTESERTKMIQRYAISLPTDDFDKEQRSAIEYLAAKGIIDPTDITFSEAVTFRDVEPLLLRIADKDSRIQYTSYSNITSELARDGYVEAPIRMNTSGLRGIEEVTNPFDTTYYDYLVECKDGFTNFYLKKLNGNVLPSTTDDSTSITVESANTSGNGLTTEKEVVVLDNAFACDKIALLQGGEFLTSGSGYFEYVGVREIFGKYYYHMRISKDIEDVQIGYLVNPLTEELTDLTSYSLPEAGGGVYTFEGENCIRKTFDACDYSDYFLDKERNDADKLNMKLTETYLSDYSWYLLYFDKQEFESNNGYNIYFRRNIGDDTDVFSFSDLQTNISSQDTGPIPFTLDTGNICYWYTYLQDANTQNEVLTILCQAPMDKDEFKQRLVVTDYAGTMNQRKGTAYYRYDDGTLLVSVRHLQQAGLISGVTELPNGRGYSLTLQQLSGTNVILREDLQIIIVGDTLYKTNEKLYFQETEGAGDLYINFRACQGWTGNTLVLSADGTLVPVVQGDVRDNQATVKYSTKSMMSLYPQSSVNVGHMIYEDSHLRTSGIPMTTNNALGSYLLVEGDNNTDYLYVWHTNNLKDSGGQIHQLSSDVISQFKADTGIDISGISDRYILTRHVLSRLDTGDQHGFRFIKNDWVTAYTAGTNNYGYIYTPKSFSTVQEALDAWAAFESSDTLLPIGVVNQRLFNLNLNTCTDADGNEQLVIGRLPYYLGRTMTKSNMNKMGQPDADGLIVEDSATYDNFDNLVIIPAPVGFFQVFKGLGQQPVAQTGGTLYYGSSLAKVINDKLTINKHALEFDTSTQSVCAYRGVGNSSIWVVNGEVSSISGATDIEIENVETKISDPARLVDWDKYTFVRLITTADRLSSIALIFALNILPRIAMFLFFALMLLSLIKDWRLWVRFCEEKFDVYKALTLGHQNIHTVDMKKLFWISLCCLILFSMIMDGVLFNIFFWCVKFFIALTQR